MRFVITLGLVTFWSTSLALAQIAIGFGDVEHDASQQVEATADSLRMDQDSGRAVFTGNVVIIQGDLRISADEVTVVYGTGDAEGEVDRVDAAGSVVVTRGADAAESRTASYDVASGLMEMLGEVLVTQGPTAISGERMVVDLATGNGTVEGRVRTVLRPGGDQ